MMPLLQQDRFLRRVFIYEPKEPFIKDTYLSIDGGNSSQNKENSVNIPEKQKEEKLHIQYMKQEVDVMVKKFKQFKHPQEVHLSIENASQVNQKDFFNFEDSFNLQEKENLETASQVNQNNSLMIQKEDLEPTPQTNSLTKGEKKKPESKKNKSQKTLLPKKENKKAEVVQAETTPQTSSLKKGEKKKLESKKTKPQKNLLPKKENKKEKKNKKVEGSQQKSDLESSSQSEKQTEGEHDWDLKGFFQ